MQLAAERIQLPAVCGTITSISVLRSNIPRLAVKQNSALIHNAPYFSLGHNKLIGPRQFLKYTFISKRLFIILHMFLYFTQMMATTVLYPEYTISKWLAKETFDPLCPDGNLKYH